MKFVSNHLALIIVGVASICISTLLHAGKLHAQTMTVGDPMFNYLRQLEGEGGEDPLPSLMLRPVSAEDYLQKLNFSSPHPWRGHPFFNKNLLPEEIIPDELPPDTLQTHLVKPGETLYSISRLHNISVEELMQWNHLEGTIISIDQELIVEKPEIVEIDQGEPEKAFEKMIRFYTPVSKVTYNNNFPTGQNDGVLWQGKGLNTRLSAGAYISYGPVRASIRPNVVYSSNRDFTLSRWPPPEGVSKYGYEFSMIDYPQRFGNQSINKIDPGQSWIRAEYREFSAGVSTSNNRFGPAVYNPVVFSSNAPGFPHFFIGTHEPVQTSIGNFEGKLLWGRLRESDFFDENDSNNLRLINGLVFIYTPRFLKDLHLGFSRVFVKPSSPEGYSFGDYFLALRLMQKSAGSEVDRLQMTSFFGRWRVPGYGFELYAEWARNTPASSIRDLLLHPEHSRAYSMGFMKRFILLPDHWLTLNFELTQLERPRSVEYRVSEPFYRSNAVKQGYTHEGQVLGAGIGPGSNSQKVHVRYYSSRGMFGVSFNRIVHDNTRLYENYEVIGERSWGIRNPRISNEVEFRYGINAMIFLFRTLELQFDVYRTRFFHHEHGVLDSENPNVYNTNLQFTLRYNFNSFLR